MVLTAWLEGRPERKVLVSILGFGAAASLLFALLPQGAVDSVLSLALPRTSASGGVRDALLSRHRVVFFALFVLLAAVTVLAPPLSAALDRALGWMGGVNRTTFFLAVFAMVVVSRGALVNRMLPIIPGQDTGHYHQLANTLLDEGRFIEYASHPNEPDGFRAWRLPGYPAALAGALLVSGRRDWAVVALNTIWMLVLVGAIYTLVKSLATERAGRLAALVVALYPGLLTASLTALSELQFGTLVAVSVALLAYGRGSLKHSILGGVVLGLAALTRGNGLLMFLALAPIYAGAMWWAAESRGPETTKRAVSYAAAFGVAFVLTMSPWTVRNRVVLDAWVPLATNGGWNMWLGHRPFGDGRIGDDGRREGRVPPLPLSEEAGELERNTVGMRESLKFWRAEPLANLIISARIVTVILKVDQGALPVIEPESRAVRLALFALFNGIYYGMWLLFGVWLIAALLGRWPPGHHAGPVFFVGLLYVATYIPFIAWSRYKVPALPFLIGGACIVLAMVVSEVRSTAETTPQRPLQQ